MIITGLYIVISIMLIITIIGGILVFKMLRTTTHNYELIHKQEQSEALKVQEINKFANLLRNIAIILSIVIIAAQLYSYLCAEENFDSLFEKVENEGTNDNNSSNSLLIILKDSSVSNKEAHDLLAIFFRKKYDIDISTSKEDSLYHLVYEWLGTPYLHAGSSKKGVDDIGLVNKFYWTLYNDSLSKDIKKLNQKVSLFDYKQVKAGDLLLFKRSKKEVDHIGIYLDNNRFLHTSREQGVVISKFDSLNRFHQEAFYKAARLKGK